jgi:hypothetical protein
MDISENQLYKWPINILKMLEMIIHEENANQNHLGILLHSHCVI